MTVRNDTYREKALEDTYLLHILISLPVVDDNEIHTSFSFFFSFFWLSLLDRARSLL